MSFTLYSNAETAHQFPNDILDLSTPQRQMLSAIQLLNRFATDAEGKVDIDSEDVDSRTMISEFFTPQVMDWISRACFFMKEKREEYEAWAVLPYTPKKDRFGKEMRPPEVGIKHLPVFQDCDLIYPEKRKGFVPKTVVVVGDDIQKVKEPYSMQQDFKDYGPLGEMCTALTQDPIFFAQVTIACGYLDIEYLADFCFYLILEYRHQTKDVEDCQIKYYEHFKECPELLNRFRATLNLRKDNKIRIYETHDRLMPRINRDFEAESTEDDYDTDVEKGLTTGHEFVEANYHFSQTV